MDRHEYHARWPDYAAAVDAAFELVSRGDRRDAALAPTQTLVMPDPREPEGSRPDTDGKWSCM